MAAAERSEQTSSRLNHATAWLSLLAGLLTLAVAVLGIVTVRANQSSTDVQQVSDGLKAQNDKLQKDLAAAQGQISDLGGQLDKARKDLAAATASGAGPSTSAASSPATGPATDQSTAPGVTSVALADPTQKMITANNGINRASNVKINGKLFIYGFTGCWIPCSSASIDIDLNKSYTSFTARIGITDDSSAGKGATVQVLGDGRVLVTKRVTLGTSYDVTVPTTGVLRLRIVSANDNGARVGIGDPTAL